jgi:hypothetical protein
MSEGICCRCAFIGARSCCALNSVWRPPCAYADKATGVRVPLVLSVTPARRKICLLMMLILRILRRQRIWLRIERLRVLLTRRTVHCVVAPICRIALIHSSLHQSFQLVVGRSGAAV